MVDFIPQEKNCSLKDVNNFSSDLREICPEILREKMQEAAEDPQFMEDLEETMKNFKYVDSDTARELD